jgi:hypothetical protein
VLVAGEIRWDPQTGDFDWNVTSALAAALRGAFIDEPRYVDLRWTWPLRWAPASEWLLAADSRLEDTIAQLLAPIFRVRRDELEA